MRRECDDDGGTRTVLTTSESVPHVMPPAAAMWCAALALLLCAAAAAGLESPSGSGAATSSSSSSSSSSSGHCPSACTCKWKGGKHTAECVSQGLFSVPVGLPPGLQVIHLERNNFHSLPGRTFQERGLVNLQRVFLSQCRLGRVARDAFQQLTNLVELDLSWNLLTAVPSAPLRGVPHLRRLQLSGNPIAQLENASFVGLQHLTYLHLSRCQLRSIEPGALDGLPALEFLLLDNNRLTTLPAQAVSPLPRLSTLHLQGNPWQCDCRLSSLRRWMRTRNIPLGEPPRCAGPPRLESASWDELSLEQFACPPQVHADSLVSVQEGRNATLVCRVRADPPAVLRWEAADWGAGVWNSTNGEAGPDLDSARFQVQREQSGPFQLSWLSVAHAGPYDAGVYICVAENRAGLRAANTTLAVVQAPPVASGLSRTHKVVIVLASFLALVILALLLCFVVARQRALAASRAKFPGMLKQLARKADLVEVATPSDTKAAQLAAMQQRSPHDGSAQSPTDPGDRTTPDLVHGKSGAGLDYSRQPNGYGPVGNGYVNPADPCYGQYALHDRYLEEPPEPPQRHGLYSPPEPSAAAAAAQWRVVEPAASSWKRNPVAAPPVAACVAVGVDTRYSPDEGYGEGNYEGTEV